LKLLNLNGGDKKMKKAAVLLCLIVLLFSLSAIGGEVHASPYTVAHSGTLTEDLAPSTITVNDFANYRVFQRDIGGASKSVTISGTYSNIDWNSVEARVLQYGTDPPVVVVDWTPIDTTPGGGTFSGNIIVPQGGWYNIEVRALDVTRSVLGSCRGTNKWGVGMLILCIGQSNMVGNGQPPFTVATSDLAVNYSNAGIWEHLADPYDDDSPPGAVDSDNDVISTYNVGGSMIPALANSLLQTFNFHIAFVPSAKGGSSLYSQWAYRNPSNHFDTTTLYGQSITKVQRVGGVELIIMHQGETDATVHRTEAQYEADFTIMIGNYRQDLYATIPIFICQLGTIEPGTNGVTDADVVAVRNAQHDLDNGVNIFMAATAMDQPRMDQVHYNIHGLNAIGGRMAQTIKYYLRAASYYWGPAITSAAFAGNLSTLDVQIAHRGGNDITPFSNITGFSMLSNGSPVSITSVQRSAVNCIRLTLASAVPQGATVKLRYLWGSKPNTSALVKDNSSLALPLENTTTDVTVNSSNTPPVTVDITPPSVPTGLTAMAISASQVNLSWNPSTDDVGVAGYNILRNGTQIATTTATSYSNIGLQASTTYTYTVVAFDAAGNKSVPSSPVSVTTKASDFSISASPSSQSVSAGRSTTYTVKLTALNGYNLPVKLAVSGLPSSATCTFSRNPVTPKSSGASSTLTVTTSRNKTGTYTLTITGTDTAGINHSTSVSLRIR
jgi:chitodextrinase